VGPPVALDRVPPYRQIRDYYAEQIEQDELVKGDQLPPVRELTGIWDVAHNTAAKAIALLAAEGLVETHQGRAGTVVTGRKPSHATDHTAATDSTRP
jgi:DNA-binding GntR family transcriptional regulator